MGFSTPIKQLVDHFIQDLRNSRKTNSTTLSWLDNSLQNSGLVFSLARGNKISNLLPRLIRRLFAQSDCFSGDLVETFRIAKNGLHFEHFCEKMFVRKFGKNNIARHQVNLWPEYQERLEYKWAKKNKRKNIVFRMYEGETNSVRFLSLSQSITRKASYAKRATRVDIFCKPRSE